MKQEVSRIALQNSGVNWATYEFTINAEVTIEELILIKQAIEKILNDNTN